MNIKKILLLLSGASLLLMGGIFFILHAFSQNQEYIVDTVEDIQPAPVALVFGAGLKRDGTPSDALKDRVLTAVELYQAKKVQKLLMSGDNSIQSYDEVTAMKELAIEYGVLAEDIVLDYAGFDTYDSCYRAEAIFGVTNTIAVSQEFHLPRILFTCEHRGITTQGLIADKRIYRDTTRLKIRERLAQIKAWIEVVITQPEPRFLGEKEYIF